MKPLGKEKQKVAVEKKLEERRSTASPSALNSLMKDLGSNMQDITSENGKVGWRFDLLLIETPLICNSALCMARSDQFIEVMDVKKQLRLIH